MNLTNIKEIKMKSGAVITAGTNCTIIFLGQPVCQVNACQVSGGDITLNLRCSSLPRYFSRFKEPSVNTMQKWSNDGVAKSMLGQRVEPDGYDANGSPSWMLVMGVI